MATYDKYYQKENYFGEPYKDLMEFFSQYPERGTLVDLGAGQGRDSIEISKMGYDVMSVDISSVGLDEITSIDKSIKIIKADIYAFDISSYDFILLDSMFHFYKNDLIKESKFLNDILENMKTGAIFVNCLMKSKKAEKILQDIIDQINIKFEFIENKYIDYPEANCKYHFLVMKKL